MQGKIQNNVISQDESCLRGRSGKPGISASWHVERNIVGKAKVSAAFAALGVSAALLVTGSEAAIAQSTAGDCKPYHLAVPGTDKYTVDVCLSLVQIPRTRFFEFSWRDIDTTKGSAYLAARIAGEIYTLKESGTFREPVRDVWVAGCVAGDSCTRPQQITPTG